MKIDTLDKLIAMLTLQKANLPTYQTEVGATGADIDDVNNALVNLTYLRDYADLIDANKKTVIQMKQAAFNGVIGGDMPPFPTFPAGSEPKPPLLSGYLDLANARNKRFKLGPGYNKEIGIALGIDADAPNGLVEATVKPTIEVTPAQTGYMFSIVISNRGASDMSEVLILRKDAVKWTFLANVTGKSADVTVVPTTDGDPEQFQVRVQGKKRNADYGLLSDPTYVTINP